MKTTGNLRHQYMKFLLTTILMLPCLYATAQCGADSARMSAARDGQPALEDTLMDASLRSVILRDDYARLITNREKALDILNALESSAYGLEERDMVRRLLSREELPFTTDELTGYVRVRSIQVRSLGIFSYPYFRCRFRKVNGRMFFEKTSGSQRKSGFLYDNKPTQKIFLGGWSVNNEPQTAYGSDNSEAGMLYKTGEGSLMMLFVTPGRDFEIYEIKK